VGTGVSLGDVCAVCDDCCLRTEAYVGAGSWGNGAVGSFGPVGNVGAECRFGAVGCADPGNGGVVNWDGAFRGEVRGAAVGGRVGGLENGAVDSWRGAGNGAEACFGAVGFGVGGSFGTVGSAVVTV
jgi:hypothetical protein